MHSNDFVKFRPSTFFQCKKVNLTFIHAKKFFFNVVFNGKKVSLTKKYDVLFLGILWPLRLI